MSMPEKSTANLKTSPLSRLALVGQVTVFSKEPLSVATVTFRVAPERSAGAQENQISLTEEVVRVMVEEALLAVTVPSSG